MEYVRIYDISRMWSCPSLEWIQEILLFYQQPHSSHSLLRVPHQCWGPCLVPQTGHLDNDKPSPTKICTTEVSWCQETPCLFSRRQCFADGGIECTKPKFLLVQLTLMLTWTQLTSSAEILFWCLQENELLGWLEQELGDWGISWSLKSGSSWMWEAVVATGHACSG